MSVTVVTPTWDWDRTLAQILKHRSLGTTDHTNIVVWSGAPIPDPDEGAERDGYVLGPKISEIAVTDSIGSLPRLRVMACKRRLSPVAAMHVGGLVALRVSTIDPIVFLHDDVEIFSAGWDRAIADFFQRRPYCGLAGFGGALGLGTHDIYQTPYQLQQLARVGYMSNADDYFNHGGLLVEPRKVSVLDGLCQIFRPDAYNEIGPSEPYKQGWWECGHEDRIWFHMYDAWAACEMKRLQWEVWALPVRFHHQGGGTSVRFSAEYESMVKGLGFESGQALYDYAHQKIYEKYQTLLPLRA